MRHTEKWIWLPEAEYPEDQRTVYSAPRNETDARYAVAEFRKEYVFSRPVAAARLRFSGDTAFQLYLNGEIIATGPASVGGDFIGNDTPRENWYAYETELRPDTAVLSFFARVRMMPVQICEYSKGHGGFMLSAILTLADGTQETVCTDETWQVRKRSAFCAPRTYDGRIAADAYVPAAVTENIWNAEDAPIPVRSERELRGACFTLAAGEEKRAIAELDMIWAGFVRIRAEAAGEVRVRVTCRELEEEGTREQAVFAGSGEYRGFSLHSAGKLLIEAENRSEKPARVCVSLIATHYPVTQEAETEVSDDALNRVLGTCRHTLKICRQTHHLDSPRHCEPLACTGDYYIESLMTLFSFGDMRLAEFDAERTAVLLERENGRMFHTTYSCIWVRMLYDTYLATGHIGLLRRCRKALGLLLARFEGYLGGNGLIETPPDYMFVDWIFIDGISLHHPPKALGQTCLNLFYFGALDAARKVYRALSLEKEAGACEAKREALRGAINRTLFDARENAYCCGLNTPTDEKLLGRWMPRNTEKRYFLKQPNILAAYFGVCGDGTARDLVRRVMRDEIEGDVQPYFLHYLLEAVFRLGMREECTRAILERWKAPVLDCPKGLVEGFVKPEPGYRFDHSHAWGGTPLYALPKALMGLEITEAGMRKIRLAPSLLGFEHAKAELLTPFGPVVCEMREGEKAKITCPPEVCVETA